MMRRVPLNHLTRRTLRRGEPHSFSRLCSRADRQYCFTPEVGEECVYTVCFEGALFTPLTDGSTGAATGVTTAAQCYRIEVHNSALSFGGTGHKAGNEFLPSHIKGASQACQGDSLVPLHTRVSVSLTHTGGRAKT
jgi:hypothetical protein